MAVTLLIPVALAFYSVPLALIVAFPLGIVFGWFMRRALRQFLKKEPRH
jgi:ABC-type phosphate transport system permease subunit